MSKLEELIKELCPDGVEYKTIEEICVVQNGYTPSKKEDSYWDSGDIPWFRMEDIRTNGRILNDAIQHITELGVRGKVFPENSLIFATTATVGEHALIKVPFVCNQQLTHIHIKDEYLETVSIDYLFHYADIIDDYCKNNTKGGSSLPAVDLQKFKSCKLPIPPLPVQEEIVRILDNFTDLTAELQAELQARAKQYEYYRDELIREKEEYPLVKLGDFATIIRGGNFQKKDFVEEGLPCIHYGQMYTHFGISADSVLKYLSEEVFNKSKKAVPNDIVMAVTSENVEDVCSCTAWLGEEEIAVSGHTAIIHHNQNPKYLSYYFHTEHFFSQKKKLAHGTKVIEVTPSSLGDVLIPLPSLEEQGRIVSILDRFDRLCASISNGLPAEIEARQKQYEYYRDKLLSFKEFGA